MDQLIIQEARALGFHEVGITQLQPQAEAEQNLQKWIQEGRHGDMKYLEDYRARHADFMKSFPDAKSVIVLGVNYFSPVENKNESENFLRGKVAQYARGLDYHDVIAKKHEVLVQGLKNQLGESFKAVSCVDSKPLLERDAAIRAGLGFWGKNTMLLSKKYGPWLFLSEIITNLDLEETQEIEGSCGTCTKCQDICPTGALDEDYKIDARLCIAYLTIEHKGIIPRKLRPKIKDWIFGCDECLSICPFTAKQQESSWVEFSPKSGAGNWLLIKKLFDLDSNREYKQAFEGTALLRASRKQMLRNACVVLGNSGDERAIPFLERGLRDKSELVRLHAAWGLGNLGCSEGQRVLLKYKSSEADSAVLAEIEEMINL